MCNLIGVHFFEFARIARRTDTCVKLLAEGHCRAMLLTNEFFPTQSMISAKECVSNAISLVTVRKTATRTHVPTVVNSDTGSSTITSCAVEKGRFTYMRTAQGKAVKANETVSEATFLLS